MSDLTIVHSSNLHIDGRTSESFHSLCKVFHTARTVQADVLLLAGDIFDHNRALALALLDRASRTLADAWMPIVILPGNHDCLGADYVYGRGGLADVPNVRVIGATDEEDVLFPEHDLEVWGHAHYDYKNMSPLAEPRARSAGRQIAMAHGHWMKGPADRHRGWLITSEEIGRRGLPRAGPLAPGWPPSAMARSRPTTAALRTWRAP